jgi:hypothetical protein
MRLQVLGHDSGAARVDATFDLELEEAGKELVEGDGGGEIGSNSLPIFQ